GDLTWRSAAAQARRRAQENRPEVRPVPVSRVTGVRPSADLQHELPVAAAHEQENDLAALGDLLQAFDVADAHAVRGDDDVARTQAALRGRAVRLHVGDLAAALTPRQRREGRAGQARVDVRTYALERNPLLQRRGRRQAFAVAHVVDSYAVARSLEA